MQYKKPRWIAPLVLAVLAPAAAWIWIAPRAA